MKLLARKDFMKMPEGTIFAKGKPWYFSQISLKAQSMGEDFVYLNLANIDADDSGDWSYKLTNMLETGASYPFYNDGFARDGCFNEDDLFLVFEKDDLVALRGRIDEALAVVMHMDGTSETL